MSADRDATAAHIRRLLRDEGPAVSENAGGFNRKRRAAVADLDDYDELTREARAIKEDAIERLPELLSELEASVEANGGTLYVADDAADANAYVADLVGADDTVVKSKSMTTEELDLNDALEDVGAEVFETDLGEFVIQVADESPSHIVGPAMHRSEEWIADLFAEEFEDRFDGDPPRTAQELTQFAREYLGEQIREADVGITGANFLIAESGTMALVTNEGNARKCAVTPDTHVAVTGVEKILPTVSDLRPFAELIARSATGQTLPGYLSLLTPPVETPTIDFEGDAVGSDDREFHLVLIDNGRLAMREDDDLRETLYCIRCGACANVCANFQQVGGHAFGGETYSGGIATGWETGVHGIDSAAEFNDLCTGCTRCIDACPVNIDIPRINTVVRDRINRGADPDGFDFLVEGLTPDNEPGGLPLDKRLFGNIETLARAGSALAPVSNWLADSRAVRFVLDRAVGIDRRRDLPTFQRRTLRAWAADREGLNSSETDREAVLYPDVYTNHVNVERGKAAVRTLEALGVAVTVPDVGESGRAPLSQGMVETARSNARSTADVLLDHVDAGRDVVVIEPSDLAAFRRDYADLLATDEDADRLAANSYDVLEYVYGLLENGAESAVLSGADDADGIAYHGHCQARTLGVDRYATAVLERLDYDVLTSTVECCGMAGSFGYKSAYYELSVAVGEDLVAEFTTDDATGRTVVASGTSCLDQLDELLHRDPVHPIELIAPTRAE